MNKPICGEFSGSSHVPLASLLAFQIVSSAESPNKRRLSSRQLSVASSSTSTSFNEMRKDDWTRQSK